MTPLIIRSWPLLQCDKFLLLFNFFSNIKYLSRYSSQSTFDLLKNYIFRSPQQKKKVGDRTNHQGRTWADGAFFSSCLYGPKKRKHDKNWKRYTHVSDQKGTFLYRALLFLALSKRPGQGPYRPWVRGKIAVSEQWTVCTTRALVPSGYKFKFLGTNGRGRNGRQFLRKKIPPVAGREPWSNIIRTGHLSKDELECKKEIILDSTNVIIQTDNGEQGLANKDHNQVSWTILPETCVRI